MMKILQYKKPLHIIAAITCVIFMGYLAQWLWQKIEPETANISPEKAPLTSPKKTAPPKNTPNHDLRDILSANLFQQQKKLVVNVALEKKKIPKTSQSLFLQGIISSSDPTRSLALISNKKNKPAHPYLQGDQLPSNAGTIHLILNSYVQIKHNGRIEKLELIKAKNSKPLGRNAIRRGTTTHKQPNSLSDIKSSYKKNKYQLLSKFGLVKTSSGIKLSTKKGRLPPGLRDGDVITSLNGYSMDDLDSDLDLLDQIMGSDKIEASLTRNGRNIHFNIPKKILEQWK